MKAIEVAKVVLIGIWMYLKATIRFIISDKFRNGIGIIRKNVTEVVEIIHKKVGDEGIMIILCFMLLGFFIIWALI